jgi:hypothetical protein
MADYTSSDYPSFIRRDVSGLEPRLSGSSVMDSTSYNPGNWNVPLPGAGSTIQPSSWASNVNWGGVVGTGIPLVASLFAGNRPDVTPQINEVQSGARALGDQGRALAAQGQAALGPALQYYQSLLSGNPADVMAATAPDRRRVIDQYDTARRSSGQFTPRGGGQASTQQELRGQEAGLLATLGAQARQDAAGATANIGQNLLQGGIGAEQQSQQQLAQMIGPLFNQEKANSDSTLQTIAGIASLAAMFI